MGRVLVVEDDHSICEVICEALRDDGLSVECVRNDRDAYGRIVGLPTLDGVVLDLNLGEATTGYDVARFARQVIPTVGILYVSGASLPNSFKTHCVPESAFIQKPFNPSELVEAVKSKLCRQR